MKKIILISLLCTVCCFGLSSQKIGEWKTLFSYEKDVSVIAQSSETIYAVSDGKLFSYNSLDNSTETYTKIGEDSISYMAYNEKNNCLVVVRSNSDIDFIYSKGQYVNISDIRNMSMNLDKTINDIVIDDDFVYLSTNYGLTVLNIPRREVFGSVLFRFPVYSTAIYNSKLYALTSNGVLSIDKNSNIQSPDSWETVNLSSKYSGSITFNDNEIRKAVAFDNKLVFLIPSKALYTYDELVTADISSVNNPQRILNAKNRLIVSNPSNFYDFTTLSNVKTFNTGENDLEYVMPDNTKSNEYWVAFKDKQLSAVKATDNDLSIIESEIRPNGPTSNFHFNMIYQHGKLVSVGGSATNQPAGIAAQLNELKGNIWFQFNKKEIDDILGINSRDFVKVAINPSDPEHIFVTCFGGTDTNGTSRFDRNGGVYEFKKRKLTNFYNHLNTPAIESVFAGGNVVLMMGLDFDKKGNLWVQNPLVTNNSIVVRKTDGSWVPLFYSDITQKNTNPRSILIDKFNNKWSATHRGDDYLFIFNEGDASIENTIAHNTKYLPISDSFDQDGQSVGNIDITCLKEDRNGNIWVGTNTGLFLIYNSPQILKRDIVFNKIKVPKNDGTNEANILLENSIVQDIEVDGANRKWIATNSGLYVVSSNGMETYHYFTNENSILPSNNILSLAIDQTSGIVYIGTDKGIVSFKGEATEGSKDYSNVYAYPNPVRPEYDGPITISGLKEKSTIKITDIKGNLIQQGSSLGGQYIWDGRNTKKEKVTTGVYLVFGSSEDGTDGVVTKIMIVSN